MISKSTTMQKKQGNPFSNALKAQPWAPHPYQKKALKFLLGHGGAGLFLDPGLGKTSIGLAGLKVLKKEGMLRAALIVAPLRVCFSVWPKEIKKWADFNGLTYVILHGKNKEELLEEKADIYLINPEGLQWLMDEEHLKRFKKLNVCTLIVDESSKFKKTSTQRFKILKPYLPKFKRRWIFTGSPAPNGLMDLFGQVYILDLGRALSPYITHYRKNFFTPSGFGGYEWKIIPGAEERINKLIKPLVLRLDAKDYLELPQIVTNNIVVQLPPIARKIYDAMEKEMIATLEGGKSSMAVSAASASMKCRQIASGGVYHDTFEDDDPMPSKKLWTHVHDAKTEAIEDLIGEMQGRPILIGYEFKHDLDRLQKLLGKNVPYIGGGVSTKRSTEIEELWNADKLPVLLGQPQSMGHGLNLQGSECNTVAWYSPTWNYELYDQFIKRVARQGSKHKRIFVHHIIAENTTDEAVIYSIKGKHKTQKDFLDALRTYVRAKEE